MTTVVIDIRNIASKTYPDDRVVFRSPEIRENPAGGIVSTAEESVALVDGQGSIDLTPGPVTVFVQCRGVADNRAKEGAVPATGPVTLVDVIAGSFTYTPAAISAAVQARNEARAAADAAEASESAAATSASSAASSASTASSAASTATSAKNQAASSATAADASKTAAATSASTASSAASTATAAKNQAASSASAAAASATTAGTKATEASDAADRAEAGADRVGTAEQVGTWATQAADSASTASSAASTATTAKDDAATSATNAATSASNASSSASAANSSKTAAATSASNAATSASTATTKASEAATSASNAATSASTVTNKATEASNSASAAASSASTATNKAIEASNSADRAEAATAGKADLIGGKVPTSQIPEIALTKPAQVTSRAGMLALNAQEGDIAIITTGADKGTYILGTGASNVFDSWMPMAVSSDVPVQSVNGQVGTVVLSATDVGASPTNHTHTPASIGAAPTSHTHTLTSLGAAAATHTHTPASIGAAAATHTHTSAQISDATSNATASMVVKRDTNGRFNVTTPTASAHPTPKTYVDSGLTDVYTAMYQRPALFSGAGNPPSSIPGAVVGDWWLNTITMELFIITGV